MGKTVIFKRVLVIIPCYNEAENIAGVSQKLEEVTIEGCQIDLLFINDASVDKTRTELILAGAAFLDNPVNLGIGGTVQLGFMYAVENNYDIGVQLDGDGQHPPAELKKLVLPVLRDEADVCIGSRFVQHEGFQST